MTRCDKISSLLPLGVMGDLEGPEAEQLRVHLEQCVHCAQEAQSYEALLQALKTLPLPIPGPAFFQKQSENISHTLETSASPEPESVPGQELIPELRALKLPDPGDAFFARQRQAIQQGLGLEATGEEDWTPLVAELQEMTLPDPGELFFRRQLKAIDKQVRQEERESQESWRSAWFRPIAVAAALFFLVLGVARITQMEHIDRENWQAALQYMAEEELDSSPSLDLEELDHEQLDLLASNLEISIYQEDGEGLVEENPDYEDLGEGELDILIQRLEARAQT